MTSVDIISFGADRRTCSPPRLVAVGRSKLVVGVVLDARFVAGGRATMQQQHLHLRVGADAFGPDVKHPFRLAHPTTIARETAKTAHFKEPSRVLLTYFSTFPLLNFSTCHELVPARPEPDAAARRNDRRKPAPHGGAMRRSRGARRPRAGLPGDVSTAVGADDRAGARAARVGRAEGRPRRHLGAEPLRMG